MRGCTEQSQTGLAQPFLLTLPDLEEEELDRADEEERPDEDPPDPATLEERTAPLDSLSFFWAFCWSCLDPDLGEAETCFWEGATREGFSLASDPLRRTGATTPTRRFSEAPPSSRVPEILWLG